MTNDLRYAERRGDFRMIVSLAVIALSALGMKVAAADEPVRVTLAQNAPVENALAEKAPAETTPAGDGAGRIRTCAKAVIGSRQGVAQFSVCPESPLTPTPLPVECCVDGPGVTAGLLAQHSTGRGAARAAAFLSAQDEAAQEAPAYRRHFAQVKSLVAEHYPAWEQLYRHLHANPELSLQEEKTAARIAAELRATGVNVTDKVGGHGVVGVLKNGPGPTLLVRADMDGLPIVERTGLPYASQVKTRDRDDKEVGVMHACGHDVNMTCLVGVAKVMTQLQRQWSGTIVFVGQPAEEIGAGARAMLADGLFTRFPKPDFAFALHCDARYVHGMINYREGQMQANVDSVDVVVKGKGGHGAAPHTTIDPVVLACRIVLDLQTIVSRELNPLDAAVVTVGSIHGGTKHNIIPNEVRLQLTVRTTNDEMRKHVLEAIGRVAKAAAAGARAPEPEIRVDPESFTPALVNDPELTRRTVGRIREVFGAERVVERPMSLGGEDFSQFVLAGVPGCYFFVGTAPPERVAEAKQGGRPLASTHSDQYFPVPEPSIKAGVQAMSVALLGELGK